MRLRAAVHLSVAFVSTSLLLCGAAWQVQADTSKNDRLEAWYAGLSASPIADVAGRGALEQAQAALQAASQREAEGDRNGARRARLIADAALTLASRQQARAATTQELEAARARVQRLKEQAQAAQRSGAAQ